MQTPSTRKAFVLATGPSMNQATADAVRGRGLVVAVSDAYRLAPWADALVSTDLAWWDYHQPGITYKGPRVTAKQLPGFYRVPGAATCWNSGVLATAFLRTQGLVGEIVLLGCDMKGSHFFGPHPEGLKNTPDWRWPVFERQWRQELAKCKAAGISLVNATPETGLLCVPRVRLEETL